MIQRIHCFYHQKWNKGSLSMKNISQNKIFKPIYLIGSNYEVKRDYGGSKYRFCLAGVPPNQALKLIKVDPNQSIAEIEKSVQREYKLNPILGIQFIFKGKVLPDQLKFEKIGINLKKDIITVMSTQGGGAKTISTWKKKREVIKDER